MARLGDHLGVSHEKRGNSYHFLEILFVVPEAGAYGITYVRV